MLSGLFHNELDEMEDEDRLVDLTDNKCEYCITVHVKQVPPKRPLSPFIFFSQEVSSKPSNSSLLWPAATESFKDDQPAVVNEAGHEALIEDLAQYEGDLDVEI